jgi:hypothetical protein
MLLESAGKRNCSNSKLSLYIHYKLISYIPLIRLHSALSNYGKQTPWVYEEFLTFYEHKPDPRSVIRTIFSFSVSFCIH